MDGIILLSLILGMVLYLNLKNSTFDLSLAENCSNPSLG